MKPTINAEQRKSIMKLWGLVCKDRGWRQSDRALRLATFGKLIGREIESTDQVERIDECTKLMKELQSMLGVSTKAAQEADNLYINKARVLRNVILTELVPCLELYVDDVKGYIQQIMEDKNRWWKIDRPTREMSLMDLTAEPIRKWDVKTKSMKEFPSQLDQMVYTLSSCLNGSGRVYRSKKSRLGFRVQAGHTLHEMKTKAGVPCDCAECGKPKFNVLADLPAVEAEQVKELVQDDPY